ncbi:MAG: hypothetical protein HZC36_06220 [Armatimonadetes bacterium]|nr:hypothetical protein [Armatimonadota bacterium]
MASERFFKTNDEVLAKTLTLALREANLPIDVAVTNRYVDHEASAPYGPDDYEFYLAEDAELTSEQLDGIAAIMREIVGVWPPPEWNWTQAELDSVDATPGEDGV